MRGWSGLPKRSEFEECDWPGAHREHVAQNAADPGRRPLVGLDKRGVVVALDLEDDRVAVADVDNAGIFAGAANNPWA